MTLSWPRGRCDISCPSVTGELVKELGVVGEIDISEPVGVLDRHLAGLLIVVGAATASPRGGPHRDQGRHSLPDRRDPAAEDSSPPAFDAAQAARVPPYGDNGTKTSGRIDLGRTTVIRRILSRRQGPARRVGLPARTRCRQHPRPSGNSAAAPPGRHGRRTPTP